MGFDIHRSKAGIGSGYVEICGGKYSGKHWQAGCVFIEEEEFLVAEGIIGKHFAEFSHLGPNDLPRAIGKRISAEWRATAERLPRMTGREIFEALNLGGTPSARRTDALTASSQDIARMLVELADECDKLYEREEWICILGV